MKRLQEDIWNRRGFYSVSFHDGIKKHNDGSEFYDIKIFHNKKAKDKFIQSLRNNGYEG